MSEENQESTEASADAERAGPRCGERLAEARRDQEISIDEVAKELHLDEYKVRALESNDFDVLGAAVFAKGHLRKYSQLVGVDEGDVFVDYYEMTRAEGMPPIVSRRKKVRQGMSPGPWIAAAVFLLIAAATYWWFVVRLENSITEAPPQESPATPASEPEVQDEGEATPPTPAEQPADQPADQSPNEAAAETTEQEEAALAPAEAVAQDSAVATDLLRLSIVFSGECWTEVSDADGRQLFFSMGRDGQTVDLSGRAPITALFGNADNVSVRVNDNPYALPAPNAANNTVRVAILDQ